jgi:glycosyltransferase involved in cell wall biosynthesis
MLAPNVTWLLPVKNAMPYLPEALASIEAQTYRNWTVIAWDNGSTDGSLEVLHEWIPSRLPGVVVRLRS